MGQSSYEHGGMYSPLDYGVMRAVLVRGGAYLVDQFGDVPHPLPNYYGRATEFLGRMLDLLDAVEEESPEEVITSISALTYAVRQDMAAAYGAPLGAASEVAIDAHEGTVLGREAIAYGFVDFAADHPQAA